MYFFTLLRPKSMNVFPLLFYLTKQLRQQRKFIKTIRKSVMIYRETIDFVYDK